MSTMRNISSANVEVTNELAFSQAVSFSHTMATLKAVAVEVDYGRGCMFSKVPDASASTVSQSHSGDNVFVPYNSTNGALCLNYGTLAGTSATTGRSVDGYLEYDHVQASARL